MIQIHDFKSEAEKVPLLPTTTPYTEHRQTQTLGLRTVAQEPDHGNGRSMGNSGAFAPHDYNGTNWQWVLIQCSLISRPTLQWNLLQHNHGTGWPGIRVLNLICLSKNVINAK
jgi:hypothetical protein